MMKILALCFVYFAFLTIVHSQEEFAPPGAEWIFSYSQFNYEGFEYITYDRDTIIDGESTKILSRLRRYVDINAPTDTIEENISDAYIRQEGDQIFQYYLDSFHLIFDFGWEKGTQYEVVNNENVSIDAEGKEVVEINLFIDSVSLTNIDGKSLIRLKGQVSCQAIDVGSLGCITIIEAIGPIDSYLFYTESSCSSEAPILYFKSYTINDVLIYSSEEECPKRTTAIKTFMNIRPIINIYPNPTSNYFQIKKRADFSIKIKNLSLVDHLGSEVMRITGQPWLPLQIDVSHLLPGVYFLKTTLADNSQLISKVIKI